MEKQFKSTESMSFSIDKQTLDELNILGRFRHNSVYNIFNKVKTAGGERLLNKLFHQPLTEADTINKRSAIFQFFQKSGLIFPFDAPQVQMMREYLDTATAGSSLLSLAQILIKKLLADFLRDERYRKMIQGLQATMVCLQRCRGFINNPQLSEGPIAGQVKRIQEILSDERLVKLCDQNIYEALSVKNLAFYDFLLKHTLRHEMEEMLTFIDTIDVYIAVAHVAELKGFGYANALLKETNLFNATQLWHPAIDKSVGNDLYLNEQEHIMFLTGANMAGKSTLMKSAGIALYLAHMGFPVPAKSMSFSVRDGLYTSINVADNMDMGYSHFYAEVMRVKEAAEATASGKKLMLIFDELFKGTNVKDAYDGTFEVTRAFAGYQECLFIVSTHIIEVGAALKTNGHIQFRYLPTIMDGPYPRYTYQLKQGITEDRQGMMMIRNEGILELLAHEDEAK